MFYLNNFRGRNLFFSTEIDASIKEADIIFVCVNTPTKTHGIGAGSASNIKNVEACARNIAKVCDTPKIIVEKSTVPVKTGEAIARIVASCGFGINHSVLNNPEFLAEVFYFSPFPFLYLFLLFVRFSFTFHS